MTSPRIIGLDASLTSTGVALPDGSTETWATKLVGEERLDWLRFQLDDTIWADETDLVAIEGYSYASANQAHQVGELGGVLRLTMHRLGIPFVVVPPSSLKLYATGSGKAPKNEMLAAAIRRLGYDGHSDDEADALFLRAAALDHYGYPVVDMPAANRAALDKITWPELAQ